MPKKFTVKPIQGLAKQKNKRGMVAAGKKFENFYENNKLATIEKPNRNHSLWFLVILVSILFGFASSLLYNFLFNENTNIDGNQKVIIERQEDVTVTAEERLLELSETINPVIVNFYDNSSEVSGPFYQDVYSFGSGFILTSDGWIVTTQEVLDKAGDKNYIILTADYRAYEIQLVLKDSVSSVVFVKINASDLTVAKLGSLDTALSGQKVYGFIASYPQVKIASLHLADLQATILEDVVASTEKFSHFISAREGYNPSLIGAPIINLAGEILAIVNSNQTAVPMDYLTTAISDLIGKNSIDRAKLGVHYINLAKYPRLDLETGEMMDKGALLSGFRNLTAVEKGGPADKAGLKVGDIILQVEDELINSRKTLTQVIQEYKPGETLKLTVLQNSKEKVVEIILEKMD